MVRHHPPRAAADNPGVPRRGAGPVPARAAAFHHLHRRDSPARPADVPSPTATTTHLTRSPRRLASQGPPGDGQSITWAPGLHPALCRAGTVRVSSRRSRPPGPASGDAGLGSGVSSHSHDPQEHASQPQTPDPREKQHHGRPVPVCAGNTQDTGAGRGTRAQGVSGHAGVQGRGQWRGGDTWARCLDAHRQRRACRV